MTGFNLPTRRLSAKALSDFATNTDYSKGLNADSDLTIANTAAKLDQNHAVKSATSTATKLDQDPAVKSAASTAAKLDQNHAVSYNQTAEAKLVETTFPLSLEQPSTIIGETVNENISAKPVPRKERDYSHRDKVTNYSERLHLRISKEQLQNVKDTQDKLFEATGRKYSVSELVRTALAGETKDVLKAIARAQTVKTASANPAVIARAIDALNSASTSLKLCGMGLLQSPNNTSGAELQLEKVYDQLRKIGVQLQQAGYGDGSIEDAGVRGYSNDRRNLLGNLK